ncbi:MAG: Hsp20/alpha crystallin family protein [Armatimonadota bacterium]|nr:Hsp20/alpha crystallin family protein [Armatimonadota bacterium]MCX7777087.1 Hsp20/alpha crystallin family protein [Armatimonadota bacterium]MDW8025134.1 Hsp20/alpha crystallin family protein [Armatimonadota bacterium]
MVTKSIASLKRLMGILLSSMARYVSRFCRAPYQWRSNRPKRLSCRIVSKTLAKVCEGDDHITVAFPMPHGSLSYARIRTSSTSVFVETKGTVILLRQLSDGQHGASFSIDVTVRQIRHLPVRVDASRGFATMDGRHKLLLVHLPKAGARHPV